MQAEEEIDRRDLAEELRRLEDNRQQDTDGRQDGNGGTGEQHIFDEMLELIAGAQFRLDTAQAPEDDGEAGENAEAVQPPKCQA